jgi:hypothetical protein
MGGNVTVSGLCSVMICGISSVEPYGSATRDLISWLVKVDDDDDNNKQQQ